MYYLLRLPMGERVHGTVSDPRETTRIRTLCGQRDVSYAYSPDICYVAAEDLCKSCFIPFRLDQFHRQKREARAKLQDPIDAFSLDEARGALKRIRQKVNNEGTLVDDVEFNRLLERPVSGRLTITVELRGLDPKVLDFDDVDFYEGFHTEVVEPLEAEWSRRNVALCWWNIATMDLPFKEAIEVTSVEFESDV